MPVPVWRHGDRMIGGIVQGRTWTGQTWEYRIIHPSAGILHVQEVPK